MKTKTRSRLISLALLSVGSFLSLPAYTQDNARTSVDWDGYYAGTVPCASCSGITTWLYLNEFNGKPRYDLVETYQQDKPETFRSSGKAKWQKEGSTLELKAKGEDRVLFVSEGYVEFLGEGANPSKDGKSDYALWKQDAYAGNGEQLLVDPRKVKKTGEGDAQRVSFTGLMNFEHKTEAGHKSLQADYVIHCKSKEYEMPKIAYFAKAFATGKMIDSTKANTNEPQPFSGKDDVIAQAAEAYCKR